MSTKFRNCGRSLAAALDQAAEEVPSLSSSSPNSVSSFHNCSLIRTSQDDKYVFDHCTERPDCMCFRNEDFQCCKRPSKLQDLCGLLEDLVAKLEFENELNHVYSRSLLSKIQYACHSQLLLV